MLVFLNGRIVPEEAAVVSVFDRSFLYGDGLFETLRVFNSKPFRWGQHLERLRRGAEFLKIRLPLQGDALRGVAEQLISRNQMPDALLRVTLSRGVGIRGYSPAGAENPTLVMSLHPAPGAPVSGPAFGDGGSAHAGPEAGASNPRLRPRWKLVTSSFRIPANEPLAQYKTCNKLPQILARAEADAAGADEALLLNTDGLVVEAASSNLFWIEGNAVCTPPLATGILAGVTRAVVLEICASLGVATHEAGTTVSALRRCGGVFLSLSSWGVVEAKSVDGQTLKSSTLVARIRRAYRDLLHAETQ